jgi:aspartyl protease family protein
MRSVLVFIFAIGLFASLVGQLGSHSSRSASPLDRQSDGIAEVKERGEATFSSQDGSIELERQPDGHFYADVLVNGATIHMVVDTGASIIALSRADAQNASIATSIGENDVVGQGADGDVHGEFARLDDVELGPLSAKGVEAVILDNGGQSLLGQNFLSKFDSVQIEGDRMILR